MIDTDLSRYETYLRSEERSANTIAKYLRDLRVFFTFMGNESLCKEAVVSFKGYLTESYAPASVNSMLAAVNGFLEWSGMPQMKVKPLKIQKCLFAKPEKELTQEEYCRLIKAAEEKDNHRLAMLLQTICATGIRVSELIGLELADLNMQIGYITCRDGVKERLVPFGKTASQAMGLYLERGRRELLKGKESPWLFTNCSGRAMSRQGFWKIIKYYGEKAGIQADITPHTLRHSFAAHLIRGGADIHAVQAMLGHSDSTTAQMYAAYSGNTVRENYRAALPRK